MNQLIMKLLSMVITVLVISLTVAIPILVLIFLMERYDKFKKNKEKEIREADRIIVKQNKEIVENANSVNALNELEKDLVFKTHKLQERVSEFISIANKNNIDISDIDLKNIKEETSDETSKPDYNSMTIKELHDIARELKIKGFSRLSKADLIDKLPITLGELPNEQNEE